MFDIAPLDADADIAPLAALHRACFPDPWDAAALASLLVTPGTFCFAKAGAFLHLDGFVLARTVMDEAEILTLAVAPAARGRGIGRALLQAAITQARKSGAAAMFLEVAIGNGAALALYAGLGFVRVGQRKAYYASGKPGGGDAVVLRLPLTPNIA